jgi:hypothetical protein
MGAGFGKHQLQQPQPALLTAKIPILSVINILFIASVSLQETYPSTVLRGRFIVGSHASVRRNSKHRSATEPYPPQTDVQPKPRRKCTAFARFQSCGDACVNFEIRVNGTACKTRPALPIDVTTRSV